jgi:RimJ/RimL family protein N-acetyltransferase
MMIVNLTINHLSDFCRWVSNKNAVKYSLSAFLPEREAAWVEQYIIGILNDKTCWNQVIIANGVAVGYCGLSNISTQNRSAEYFILIGYDGYWNKGIGTQAGMQVIEYGFGVLQLHRIWLTVSECNHRAIRSYEKLGFKLEGRMREACQREGKYHDKIIMGILYEEWPNKANSADAKKPRG